MISHHNVIHKAQAAIAICSEYIGVFAGIFLVVSAVLGSANVVISLLNHVTGSKIKSLLPSCVPGARVATLAHTRIEIGSLFAIGLELLVVTDVLETLTKPMNEFSYDLLGKIGAVAIGRLVLAYFLGKEMDSLRKEVVEEESEGEESSHRRPSKEIANKKD